MILETMEASTVGIVAMAIGLAIAITTAIAIATATAIAFANAIASGNYCYHLKHGC